MIVETIRQPVIILGMHRSGTSLVARLLDDLGLFVGRELQEDHESTFFLDINTQIMNRVSAAWDYPKPLLNLFACDEAVRMTTEALAADLSSRAIRKFLPGGSLATFDKPWGWKDPRTVYTLPLWLRLFPQARLVYIVRNGIDVAKSLMVREKKLLKLRTERFDRRMKKRSFRSHLDRAAYKGSARCLTMNGGFDLWREYVEQGEANLRGMSNAIQTIKYEDLLAEPRTYLPALAEFCGLDTDGVKIEAAIKQIDGSRAGAFKTDPASEAFYQTVKHDPWMVKFGY